MIWHCRCKLINFDIIIKIDAATRGKAQALFHRKFTDAYDTVYIDGRRRRVRFTDHEARRAVPAHWYGIVHPVVMNA